MKEQCIKKPTSCEQTGFDATEGVPVTSLCDHIIIIMFV